MGKGKMSQALKVSRSRAMPGQAKKIARRGPVATGKKINVFTVRTGEIVRMETVIEEEAVHHAQGIYKDEDIIADIEVTERETNAW